MQRCADCGSEVAAGSNFCPECGAPPDGSERRADRGEAAFCRHCGERVAVAAEICPHCGVRRRPVVERNPGLAALASFVVPGAGQIYNGRLVKGFALAFGAILSIPLMLFVVGLFTYAAIWIYAVYDAYTTAERINAGEVDASVRVDPDEDPIEVERADDPEEVGRADDAEDGGD